MEEKIQEIMMQWLAIPSGDKYFPVVNEGIQQSAGKITDYIMSFIEWKDNNSNIIMFRVKIPGAKVKYKFNGQKGDFTLNELFQYWLKNIINI